MRGEQALAVGDVKQEPEPSEVLTQRAGAVGRVTDELGHGAGKAGVRLQLVAEEAEQFRELDGYLKPKPVCL
jgi:hypothetical protein